MASDPNDFRQGDTEPNLLRKILGRLKDLITGGFVTGPITIAPGDIEIGAVELKDAASDNRASINAAGELAVSPAPTTGTLTDHSGTIAAGGVSQPVMAANGLRKYLLFENTSTGDLWVNFSSAAVQGQPSLQIIPQGSLVMEASFVTTEAMTVIGATPGASYTAKES